MELADPAAALEAVHEFQRLLTLDNRDWSAGKSRRHVTDVEKMQPLIQGIAARIDPDSVEQLTAAGQTGWRWGNAYGAANRLIGILEKQEEHERILGPAGPALAPTRLHAWVWHAAADLWDGGHHAQAVEDAFKSVERRTQVKVGDLNLSGKKLYSQSFSTKEPTSGVSRLRFPDTDQSEQKDTWTSAHEGAVHLGMACAQGIRNLRAHPSSDITEQEALEQLAALSVLARWVDACEVVKADPSST